MTFGHFGKLALAIAAVGLLPFLTDSAAAAPLVNVACGTTGSNAKVYTAMVQNSGSSSFVDVIGTNVTFKQGGTTNGCVIVTFAAEAMVSTSAQMIVRALLETDAVCGPADVSFVPSSLQPAGLGARSMTFVCTNVAPGNHTVRMQFRFTGAGSVQLGARTTVVQYLK